MVGAGRVERPLLQRDLGAQVGVRERERATRPRVTASPSFTGMPDDDAADFGSERRAPPRGDRARLVVGDQLLDAPRFDPRDGDGNRCRPEVRQTQSDGDGHNTGEHDAAAQPSPAA